jgi:hypothetical protein
MILKRNTPLKPGKRIKPSNAKRRKKTFDRNFGERGGPVRDMGCLCADPWITRHAPNGTRTWCSGDTQASHTIARGMGGAKGSRRNLVPLCAGHHAESGERGTSQREAFESRYGLDLQSEAERIALELDARGLS